MTSRADRRGVLRRAVLTRQAQPFALDRYRVSQLPPASQWEGAQVHVTDETGGAVTAFSDGVFWRRITDRTVVSASVPTALSGAGAAGGALEAVVGPYLRAASGATGVLRTATRMDAALSATGATAGALQTPPKVSTALSGVGASIGTARPATRVSVALTATSSAGATLQGVAA